MNTFKQQFDKLTEAYIKDEVNPYDNCGCFVGNLLNKNEDWANCLTGLRSCGKGEVVIRSEIKNYFYLDMREYDDAVSLIVKEGYTPRQICMLENCFMHNITKHLDFNSLNINDVSSCVKLLNIRPDKEDIIFNAFSKTLDLLKEIHESRGEIVDKIEFKKRELVLCEN